MLSFCATVDSRLAYSVPQSHVIMVPGPWQKLAKCAYYLNCDRILQLVNAGPHFFKITNRPYRHSRLSKSPDDPTDRSLQINCMATDRTELEDRTFPGDLTDRRQGRVRMGRQGWAIRLKKLVVSSRHRLNKPQLNAAQTVDAILCTVLKRTYTDSWVADYFWRAPGRAVEMGFKNLGF